MNRGFVICLALFAATNAQAQDRSLMFACVALEREATQFLADIQRAQDAIARYAATVPEASGDTLRARAARQIALDLRSAALANEVLRRSGEAYRMQLRVCANEGR